MKVKHLSYEELVKLGAKCLAQPKAEVQIFCENLKKRPLSIDGLQ